MNVTTGSFAQLMEWWQARHTKYFTGIGDSCGFSADVHIGPKFLCLLTAGHLNDKAFFSSVFENQSALDLVSGMNIAVFLFMQGDEENLLEYKYDGSINLLPSKVIVSNNFDHVDEFKYTRLSELRPEREVKENLVGSSQSISSEIRKYFSLGVDDIPCIILLDRDNNYWVIKTRGEADVDSFYNLLRSLARIVDNIPDIPSSGQIKKLQLSSVIESEIEKCKSELRSRRRALEAALDELRGILIEEGVSRKFCYRYLKCRSVHNIHQILGIEHPSMRPAILSDIKPLIDNAIVKRCLRKKIECIVERNQEIHSIDKRLAELERDLDDTRRSIERLKAKKEALIKCLEEGIAIDNKIDALCGEYHRKYIVKSCMRPVRDILEGIVGFSRKTKEILSVREKLEKLLED